jgi:putative copper export protein
VLIGGLPGLLGTGYGLVALAKIVLFAILLGFAASNRPHLTPRPTGGRRTICPKLHAKRKGVASQQHAQTFQTVWKLSRNGFRRGAGCIRIAA